jgi:dihydroorotate dehydrogenase
MLKIAPDLEISQLNGVIDLALEIQLDGLVVSNTSISREGLETSAEELKRIGASGLSGNHCKKIDWFIRYITEKPIIECPLSVPAEFSVQTDAKEKMQAGAGLVQVWTGFI